MRYFPVIKTEASVSKPQSQGAIWRQQATRQQISASFIKDGISGCPASDLDRISGGAEVKDSDGVVGGKETA